MQLFKIAVILLSLIFPLQAYETADFQLEVEKVAGLTIKIQNAGRAIFNQTIDHALPPTLSLKL
jgi:hypothetical protein